MEDMKVQMSKVLDFLKVQLSKIRTGRASVDFLDNIRVDSYGSKVPVNQIASLSVQDARTIVIDPWDKSGLESITKEIAKSNLGVNPQNDGKVIRIVIPPMTEDRRKLFVKDAKEELESAKTSLRSIRHKFMNQLKEESLSEDQKKGQEKQIQKVLDEYVVEADSIFNKKEKEIMTI